MPETNEMKAPVLKLALTAFFVLTTLSGSALTSNLSKYREFQLGSDLATVAKQTDVSPSRAEVVHQRPALIQELQWRPQPRVLSTGLDSVQDVMFTFCDGVLFRIVVDYDRYQTEGLTAEDIVQAVSAAYGETTTLPVMEKSAQNTYGDQDKIVARWQDPQYRFDLIRSSYGPTFRLVGVLKTLDDRAQAAALEAKRLDDQEAPQREAARLASDQETAKANLEKARLANKAKFRP